MTDTTTTPVDTLADIYRRLAAVLAEVSAVSKDSYNPHANYRYASADAVYAMARPLLGKHGLAPHCSTLKFEVREIVAKNGHAKLWAECVYELGFNGHTLGTRNIGGYLTGSQSYGALTTYALKYWLRDILLIETGEADLDANGKDAPQPEVQPAPEPPRPASPPASSKQRETLEAAAKDPRSAEIKAANGSSLAETLEIVLHPQRNLTQPQAGRLIKAYREGIAAIEPQAEAKPYYADEVVAQVEDYQLELGRVTKETE